MQHRLAAMLVGSLFAGSAAQAAESAPFFERRIPTRWIGGAAELREVVGDNYVNISRQSTDEAGDVVTVVDRKHFRQLLEVRLQSTSWAEGSEQLEERGSLLLAMDAEWDQYDAFSKSLREALADLGPRAYRRPLAGITPAWQPLSFSVLGVLPGSPIFCLSRGDGFEGFQHRSKPRKEGGMDVMTLGVPADVCRVIEQGVGDRAPDTLDSEQREPLEDLVQRVSTVQEAASFRAAAPLNALPPEASVVKDPEGGSTVEFGLDLHRSGMPRRIVARGSSRYSAEAPPASIPADALEGSSRVIRWDLRSSHQSYGRGAAERDVTVGHVWVATLLTDRPPPSDRTATTPTPEDASRPVPQWERYLDQVGDVLEGHPTITLQSIEEAAVLGHTALLEDGYYVIICRGDGTASYYLGPAFAYNKVTNPKEVCTRLEQRLAN